MNLPELSIRRHVLAFMISGLFVLFGALSYFQVGVDRYPLIEFPIISIETRLPGADPETIDSSVTNVIETAVNSVSGINHVLSQSASGVGITNVIFNLEKDIDIAFNEVQAKVNESLPELPDQAERPVLAKSEIGGTPIIWLSLTGDYTQQDLNRYARNIIKKRLETIDGVGRVRLGGERRRTIRVNLDPDKLAGYRLTASDVLASFNRQHLRMPGGFLSSDRLEETLQLDLEFHSAEELGALIVHQAGGAPIRLRHLGTVEDGLADFRQYASANGQAAVAIGVVKLRDGNAVKIVETVMARLNQEILPALPSGMNLKVIYNDVDLISEIVLSLKEHLLLGTILTAIVVLVFLQSARSTLIIALAVPVSLLGAVAVINFAGFTLNTMTLLALLLLIGVVVDDAIVVLENIYRLRQTKGLGPVEAALEGTRQVQFAVLAATLTLVAIFGSVIFLGGIVGRLFREFSVVVATGVMVSYLVALTLTPMLCSRYLKVHQERSLLVRFADAPLAALEKIYRSVLKFSLRMRWTVVILAIAAVYSSGFFGSQLGGSFMPPQDEGRFLVTVKAPLGTDIRNAIERSKQIEDIILARDDVENVLTQIGTDTTRRVSQINITVSLSTWAERDQHQTGIMNELRESLKAVPGVQIFLAEVPLISGERGEPLNFALKGPELGKVAELADELLRRFQARAELGDIDLSLQLNQPQSDVKLNRERLAFLGIDAQTAANTINALASGLDIARYNDDPSDGERYDVRIKASNDGLGSVDDLSRLYLRTRSGELVRMDNVVSVEQVLGPAVIGRLDLQYSADYFVTPQVPLGEAVKILYEEAEGLLPIGYQIVLLGRAEEFAKTASYMAFAFITAIALVYMVLASQFNSFAQPLIIMVAQPLAIVGGLIGLYLTGHGLNIFSMIGLTLLIGLVAKNSILLVDLTNQRRAEGMSIQDALLDACPLRLRPILMTSLTVILALLPAAMGAGAGADLNGPLAVAVIGGMTTSTILSLVVVPAAYSLLENGIERARILLSRGGEASIK